MKYILIYAAISLFFKTEKKTCTCSATTQSSHQERTAAKHEKHYEKFKKKKGTIDIAYIYKWEKKYASLTKTIGVKPNNPKSLRKHNSPEDTLYTLKGYLWFVKTEGNDCDYHMEIGTKESNATRIIVEVPKENQALQKKIKVHLDKLKLKVMGCGTENTKIAHFTKGIPVTVTGLGFYDASHKPNEDHGDNHTKKYSWELHPVKDLTFL